MQADGNGAGAVSEQRNWRGYAQIALIVLALAVAWYFARPRAWGRLRGMRRWSRPRPSCRRRRSCGRRLRTRP